MVRAASDFSEQFSGLTAAITIGEGIDKLIAAGETIARPEMTLLDAATPRSAARRTASHDLDRKYCVAPYEAPPSARRTSSGGGSWQSAYNCNKIGLTRFS
jgi:hypothetical protein